MQQLPVLRLRARDGLLEARRDAQRRAGLERTTIDQLIIEFNSHSQLRDYAATVCTDLAGKNCQELRGKIDRRESDKMLDASGVYISERTVRVNGIDIQPLGNHVVVVSPQLRAIVSASATVRLGDAFLYTDPVLGRRRDEGERRQALCQSL